MSKESKIAEELEAEFFTPEFFEQEALTEQLLKCVSLEDYRKIRDTTKKSTFAALHQAASFEDPDAKRFTEAELWSIFQSLPTLTSSDAEFI